MALDLHTERAIEGAAGGLLLPGQRQTLARLSARACALQRKLGLWDGTDDSYRHAIVRDVTGAEGLRAVRQLDYPALVRRFQELAATGGRPFRQGETLARRPDGSLVGAPVRDDARRARHKLADECADWADRFGGLPQAEAYARTILWRIHKTDVEHATAKQLWHTLFTLRNRARKKGAGCPTGAVCSSGGCLGAAGAPKRPEGGFPAFPRPSAAEASGNEALMMATEVV